MKRPILFVLLLLLLSGAELTILRAQQPTPSPSGRSPAQQSTPPTPPNADEDVVRISTNLVQVDAVVTDKNGRAVTDLRPEEMQIYEDGRPRKITNFSYITSDAIQPPPGTTKIDRNAPPSAVGLPPADTRRTIALVVDDLGLSFQSIYFVRRALTRFVDEQMQSNDLVAIIRTSSGIGALQQFTADKRQLYAAIDHVKWYAGGRSGVGAFAPITPPTPGRFGAAMDEMNEDLDQFRDDLFAVGTLGAVSYVVKGLRELPGRKSILLISDGFSLIEGKQSVDITKFNKSVTDNRTLRRLQQLIDQASRASVVIYTLNGSGLQADSSIAAEDSLLNPNSRSGASNADQVTQRLGERHTAALELQSGLDFLAENTGGISIHNTNDLSGGIRRVMEDQRGYYLIGYRPDAATFTARTGPAVFHQLSLHITRPGKFNVRMRNGFYGVEEKNAMARGTARDQIVSALTSPFTDAGVGLQLTSLFANDAQRGSFLRSTLHVGAGDLTFTDEPGDWHKTTFDLVAVTFDADGKVIDQTSRTDVFRVQGASYPLVLKHGFVYFVAVPIKKPGAYQLRVVLRDHDSERVGSANQFVEIPDLKKGRLALSGIAVNAISLAQFNSMSRGGTANAHPEQEGARQEDSSEIDPAASEAVRHFRQGMAIHYRLVIYNSRVDQTSHLPQLQVQARLFCNGKVAFTGRAQPFVPNNPADMTRLQADSALQLGNMPPGEYVLQVMVTDLLAGEKYRQVSQWIDFRIVK